MGIISAHEFVSLDGVMENPAFTFDYGFDPRMGAAIAGLMARCQGILLGRTTYEMFEPAWSTRTAEQDPGAPFFNDTTKYVVSSTLRETTWRNSQVVGAYDPEAIRRLKQSVEGGLYLSGSGTLLRALVADGLLDELHLFVYPVSLGGGGRLFAPEAPTRRWRLAQSQAYENGVLYLAYTAEPAAATEDAAQAG